MLPSFCIYYCSNCYHNIVMVYLTLSPIWSRSPSLRTIGLMCIYFFYFCFFLGPTFLSFQQIFNVKGVPCPSPSPPSYLDSSCSFLCLEVDSLTSFVPIFFTSTRSSSLATLVATPFLFYSARSCISLCATSLFLCTTESCEVLVLHLQYQNAC